MPQVATEIPSAGSSVEERVSVATQWQLMWWRVRKHHLAMLSALTIVLFYLVVSGADFLAYQSPTESAAQRWTKPSRSKRLKRKWKSSPMNCASRKPRTSATRFWN